MSNDIYKEEKAQWTITTPIDLKRSLARLAKKNRRSLAAEVRIAIENYLAAERENAKNSKAKGASPLQGTVGRGS